MSDKTIGERWKAKHDYALGRIARALNTAVDKEPWKRKTSMEKVDHIIMRISKLSQRPSVAKQVRTELRKILK